MRVALPLAHARPGISGGSETYARELAAGLARVGEHEYEALVPTLAPDAGGRAPGRSSPTGYRASTTTPGRLRAMAGALRSGRERRDGTSTTPTSSTTRSPSRAARPAGRPC